MAVEVEKVGRERLEDLVADQGISLAHRALWSALWDGKARVADWLRAGVEDVDLPRWRVRVWEPVRPDTPEWVPVSELTASLLGRLIGDLTSGPLFLDGLERVTRERAFAMARSRAGTGLHAFRSGGLSASKRSVCPRALVKPPGKNLALARPPTSTSFKRRITLLEQHVTDMKGQLDERTEELDAARAANRELTRALNQAR
ncbi:hypothetical protein [Streptomyces sp. NPDC093591]|uniref:hypothetical protein n=1 Tax=Streptomyces sp. NPDC093591 TaxID=3366044 RepID=UPI00381BF0F5